MADLPQDGYPIENCLVLSSNWFQSEPSSDFIFNLYKTKSVPNIRSWVWDHFLVNKSKLGCPKNCLRRPALESKIWLWKFDFVTFDFVKFAKAMVPQNEEDSEYMYMIVIYVLALSSYNSPHSEFWVPTLPRVLNLYM